jgi:hypothetical protein
MNKQIIIVFILTLMASAVTQAQSRVDERLLEAVLLV